MIAAVLCIAMGGVGFEQVEIPELRVWSHGDITEFEDANFRHADIDGDGHPDVILPTRAILRPSGRLDFEARVPMPEVNVESRADFWNGTLYVIDAAELSVYAFDNGVWNRTLNVKRHWTLEDASVPMERDDEPPLLAFERFLFDMNDDGKPEIVRAEEAGIAVCALNDGRIETALLDLYPAPRLQPNEGGDTLWPPGERRVTFPNRLAMFNVMIDSGSATVLERIRHRGSEYAFRTMRYQITAGPDGTYATKLESTEQTGPLPRHVNYTLALNRDDSVDYAGYRHDQPDTKNWKPLTRTMVSTDGGQTIQTAATREFYPGPIFVDLDGDGDSDWVAGESGLFAGGLRETANRALFQKTISHSILARMQLDGGVFEDKWRTIGRFKIELDEPPRKMSDRFFRYRFSDLFDWTGDFNGDGWKDVLVSDRPATVSLHLGGPAGFEARAEVEIPIPPDTSPVAIDIDGDGRSDLVAMQYNDYAPKAIYLNTGGS